MRVAAAAGTSSREDFDSFIQSFAGLVLHITMQISTDPPAEVSPATKSSNFSVKEKLVFAKTTTNTNTTTPIPTKASEEVWVLRCQHETHAKFMKYSPIFI